MRTDRLADMKIQTTCRQNRQGGVALVIVLWILAFLTLMAGAYSRTMRTETLLAAAQIQSAQSRALAEAGVWMAVQELIKPESGRTWLTDDRKYNVEFGNGRIQVSLQDEAGKIDLNIARAELLLSLLDSVGVEDEESTQVLNAILDWRDRDRLARDAGAEDKEYASAGLDYGAKDGPFNSVNELRRVLGMTEEIFQGIKPALTVFSHHPGVNPDFAQREALLAIPGAEPESIDTYLQARNNAESLNNLAAITGIDDNYITRMKDRIILITSEGISNENRVKLEVIILLNKRMKIPYSILYWQET